MAESNKDQAEGKQKVVEPLTRRLQPFEAENKTPETKRKEFLENTGVPMRSYDDEPIIIYFPDPKNDKGFIARNIFLSEKCVIPDAIITIQGQGIADMHYMIRDANPEYLKKRDPETTYVEFLTSQRYEEIKGQHFSYSLADRNFPLSKNPLNNVFRR